MPRKAFFDESHVEPIARMLRSGMSARHIALQYGCDHTTVTKFCDRHLPDWQLLKPEPEPPALKILVLDIETKPGKTYFWHTNERFIRPEYVIEDTETFCWAAKWINPPGARIEPVEFRSVFHDTRSGMVTRAHELLTEADGIVTYNGDGFDLPHLNLEFLRSGMRPPRPYKSIDLLKTIRKRFRFTNNRLNRVSKSLGIGQKVEHEGFALWEKCIAGDADAWKRMRQYNIGDVMLTEDVYRDLLPWIEGHPSYAALTSSDVCTNCGSDELKRDGYYPTKTGLYPRYQCQVCGKWVRGTHRDYKTEITETAMS